MNYRSKRTDSKNFIIRARVRDRANLRGKILTTAFLDYMDRVVAGIVDDACHAVGGRKVIIEKTYREYIEQLRLFGIKTAVPSAPANFIDDGKNDGIEPSVETVEFEETE